MRTLISIPAQFKYKANELARQMQREMDGTDNGAKSFTVPLFSNQANDDKIILAYWCAVNLSAENHLAVEAALPSFPGATVDDYDIFTDLSFPQRKLKEWGLRTARPKMP